MEWGIFLPSASQEAEGPGARVCLLSVLVNTGCIGPGDICELAAA